jgi:hypothetical protein
MNSETGSESYTLLRKVYTSAPFGGISQHHGPKFSPEADSEFTGRPVARVMVLVEPVPGRKQSATTTMEGQLRMPQKDMKRSSLDRSRSQNMPAQACIDEEWLKVGPSREREQQGMILLE